MPILVVIILVVAVSIIFFIIGRNSINTDGFFLINEEDDKSRWILDVHVDPMTIPNRKVVRLKVKKITEDGDV